MPDSDGPEPEYEELRERLRGRLELRYGRKEIIQEVIKKNYRLMTKLDNGVKNISLKVLVEHWERNRKKPEYSSFVELGAFKLLNDYIYAYDINLDEDATLEEAVNSILR